MGGRAAQLAQGLVFLMAAVSSRKRALEVNVTPLSTPGSAPEHAHPPALRRLTTPDCMSSPVSHLRDLTRDLEEDGAKRRRAAQYLRESRLAHLQERRLVLVLDLDETLVHSLRSSVRHIRADAAKGDLPKAGEAKAGEAKGGESKDGNGGRSTAAEEEADDGEEGEEAEGAAGSEGSPAIGPLPTPPHPAADGYDSPEGNSGDEVTLQVQNVEFEMKLRPGVHEFLREMSSLFCVHMYTMGSREYVQQALHHLDPKHEIFKPGQVLAWNPALDRTTKTLQRLLCVPELVLIVDDSPVAWANHLSNLVLIDRYVGAPNDTSLSRVCAVLKAIHKSYFEQATSSGMPAVPTVLPRPPTSPHLAPLTLPPQAVPAGSSRRSQPPLPTIPESPSRESNGRVSERHAERRPGSVLRLGGVVTRSSPRSPLHSRGSSSPLALDATPADPVPNGAADAPPLPALPSPLLRPAEVGGSSSADADADATAAVPPVTAPVSVPLVPLAPNALSRSGADVRDLLLGQCSKILGNVVCAFAGPADLLLVDGVAPPEVQLARRCGADVCGDVGPSCTHLLVPPALLAEGSVLCLRTDALVSQVHQHRLENNLRVVDARWLIDCVSRWERLSEEDYELPLEILTQPLHALAATVPTTNPWAPKKG